MFFSFCFYGKQEAMANQLVPASLFSQSNPGTVEKKRKNPSSEQPPSCFIQSFQGWTTVDSDAKATVLCLAV